MGWIHFRKWEAFFGNPFKRAAINSLDIQSSYVQHKVLMGY